LETLIGDIRHALRVLGHSPGFAITAIAVLALGIGASTAIFSVVNAVPLEPLPFPDPDRIVFLQNSRPQGNFATASVPKYNVWHRQTQVLNDIAAYDTGGPGINLTGDRPEQVKRIHVSREFFPPFGIRTVMGRAFTEGKTGPEAANWRCFPRDCGSGATGRTPHRRQIDRAWWRAVHRDRRGALFRHCAAARSLAAVPGRPQQHQSGPLLGGAYGLTRFLKPLLFQVKTTDTASFVAVPLVLAAMAVRACYLPARRATRVDPVEALRYQ
jgi:hypothetical protein